MGLQDLPNFVKYFRSKDVPHLSNFHDLIVTLQLTRTRPQDSRMDPQNNWTIIDQNIVAA